MKFDYNETNQLTLIAISGVGSIHIFNGKPIFGTGKEIIVEEVSAIVKLFESVVKPNGIALGL